MAGVSGVALVEAGSPPSHNAGRGGLVVQVGSGDDATDVNPRVLVLLLLAVGALLAWLAWGHRDRSGEAPAPRSPTSPASPGEPRLTGTADAASPPVTHATPDPCTLRLRVLGERGVEGVARVRVVGLASTFRGGVPLHVVGSAVVGETTEFDLRTLLAADPSADVIQARVDHPACLPREGRVSVPSGYAVSDRPEPLCLTVHLETAALIRGVVVDEQGHGIEGAYVRAERSGTYWFPAKLPVPRTDADGRYRLRRSEGRFLVTAWQEGRRPAACEVAARTGESTTVPPLALREGARIAGVIRANGRPAAGATVLVARQPIPPGTTPVKEPVLHDGSVAWAGRVVRTGERGRFEICGLAPGRWHLRVDVICDAVLHPSVTRRTMRAIDAPDPSVEVDMEVARLHLRLEGPEHLPSRVMARLRHENDEGWAWVRRGEETVVGVLPRSRLGIRLSLGERWKTDAVEVAAPDADEDHDVVLVVEEARKSGATLTLRFQGNGSDALDRAFVGLWDGDQEFPRVRWEDHPVDDTAVLRCVPAGVYRMRVKPGAYQVDLGTWYVAVEQTLEIRNGQDLTVDVPLVEGGRVRLRVHDPEGKPLPATWRLTDGRGTQVADWAFAVTPSGQGVSGRKGAMPDQQPGILDPPAPPGRYVLHVALDGFTPHSREVEIRAEAHTDVDITLWPTK